MNNRRKIRLEIPEPCTADFDQMPDVGNGRFCHQCNKTVHDVAHLPDEALQLFLDPKAKVCMRLNEHQLGRNIHAAHNKDQAPVLHKISVCIIHDLMPGSILGIPIADEIVHENRWLTGFLSDETLQGPISQAIVSTGSLGIAFTDASGWFKIFILGNSTCKAETLSLSRVTASGQYRELLNQCIQITGHKVYIQANKTLKHHLFTPPTSVKIHEACTYIHTSA